MPVLKRDAVKPPVLPKEAVQVAELGGEVIVRGLLAGERLWLTEQSGQAVANGSADGNDLSLPYERLPRLLARVVSIDDGAPLYTEEQWRVFGGQHPAAMVDLFLVASRLSGMDLDDVKKNS